VIKPNARGNDISENHSSEPAADGGDAPFNEIKPAPTDFTASGMSALVHDLRNVVAPIRNAIQLLRLRSGADQELATITDLIERQVGDWCGSRTSYPLAKEPDSCTLETATPMFSRFRLPDES
jgi:hypothetical protein